MLNLETIIKARRLCESYAVNPPCVLVVTESVWNQIVDMFPPIALHPRLCGMDIFVKELQKCPAWRFNDRQVALRYVRGEITEQELCEMASVTPDLF